MSRTAARRASSEIADRRIFEAAAASVPRTAFAELNSADAVLGHADLEAAERHEAALTVCRTAVRLHGREAWREPARDVLKALGLAGGGT